MRHSTDAKMQALKKVSLFSLCTKRELREVAQLCTPMHVKEGFVMTKQGGPAKECFVIGEGTAVVTMDDHVVATVGPGDCVGEMALLDGGRRAATVVAQTAMTLYVLTPGEFSALLYDNATITRKVAASLARRLRQAEEGADKRERAAGSMVG
jgi:CRP/FNR family transcriptional regulator, cyclic AMP receptor protein